MVVMCTTKKEALHRLIDWINKENKTDFIFKLPFDKLSISGNSWLSGFIKVDGNFYLNWKESKIQKEVIIIFYV